METPINFSGEHELFCVEGTNSGLEMYKIQKPWLDSALRFTVWGSNLLAPSWARHRAEGQGGGHGVAFIEGCCLGLTDQRSQTGSFKVVDETEEGQSSG